MQKIKSYGDAHRVACAIYERMYGGRGIEIDGRVQIQKRLNYTDRMVVIVDGVRQDGLFSPARLADEIIWPMRKFFNQHLQQLEA